MLFSKHKCLIYTAFGNEKYYRVVNKLIEYGVSYETVSISRPSLNVNFARNNTTQYDIYVKEEDKHKAQQVIHV
ncbi:hypothetical protein E2636_02740 [Paenisporosarcina antarctica]|uniref:DUF2007 domain-containing protein n=1 Tax=Paenisporosarcina antarctica TaxID=417367 RepID=A0A4V1ANJ7_9BACL|nr:hypothetical protein E2636_02740 [Paenisporosarcina antarctica]